MLDYEEDPLPYLADFDPEDSSNDDKLPTENHYFKWLKKYECQICDDEDGLDFNSDHEENIERRRFLIYRLPFMTRIGGKRACPECAEKRRRKEASGSTSSLLTKPTASLATKSASSSAPQSTSSWAIISTPSPATKLTSSHITKKDAMKTPKIKQDNIETLPPRKQKMEEEKLHGKKRGREETKQASSTAKTAIKTSKGKVDDSGDAPETESSAKKRKQAPK